MIEDVCPTKPLPWDLELPIVSVQLGLVTGNLKTLLPNILLIVRLHDSPKVHHKPFPDHQTSLRNIEVHWLFIPCIVCFDSHSCFHHCTLFNTKKSSLYQESAEQGGER